MGAGFNRTSAPKTRRPKFMTKKSKSVAPRSRLNKNIDLPPISKSATGAAAGAVLGAVGGPVGAAVGGVVGAVVGKRAENEPLMPMVKRAARQTARGVKAAAKAARVAMPAAKRVVKSIRPGKGKTTKSAARKSGTAKTSSRSEKSKPTVTKARRHSFGGKNRIKGNRARAKKPRR